MRHQPAVISRPTLLSIILATAACLIHYPLISPSPQASRASATAPLTSLLPRQFAGWQLDEHVLIRPVSVQSAAEAAQTYVASLAYVYVNAERQRIMLSVSRTLLPGEPAQAHRPEFCYQSQGFTITSSQDTTLDTRFGRLPLRQLATHRPGRSEPVSYWMMIGSTAALPGWTRKLGQLRQYLNGDGGHSLLIRVSSLGTATRQAFALHDRFIVDLLTALPPGQRQQLIGQLPA